MSAQRESFAPRTYQSAWQWNDDGTAKLMTAEEWLEEEAHVDDALNAAGADAEDGDDCPNRAGIMRAIAREIAALRRERDHWVDAYTQWRRTSIPTPEDRRL